MPRAAIFSGLWRQKALDPDVMLVWEMGGAQRVLHGVLERTKGLVTGVTCGAGMPYKLSEIAASYGVMVAPNRAMP